MNLEAVSAAVGNQAQASKAETVREMEMTSPADRKYLQLLRSCVGHSPVYVGANRQIPGPTPSDCDPAGPKCGLGILHFIARPFLEKPCSGDVIDPESKCMKGHSLPSQLTRQSSESFFLSE